MVISKGLKECGNGTYCPKTRIPSIVSLYGGIFIQFVIGLIGESSCESLLVFFINLKAKIEELGTNSKIKNIRHLYRGVRDFNPLEH